MLRTISSSIFSLRDREVLDLTRSPGFSIVSIAILIFKHASHGRLSGGSKISNAVHEILIPLNSTGNNHCSIPPQMQLAQTDQGGLGRILLIALFVCRIISPFTLTPALT